MTAADRYEWLHKPAQVEPSLEAQDANTKSKWKLHRPRCMPSWVVEPARPLGLGGRELLISGDVGHALENLRY
jgi:hypothetical protein